MDIWYSALRIAVENALPVDKNQLANIDSAKLWLSAKAREGRLFKTAELEWSGLNEWLELQEGKISKESILQFIDTFGVQVKDVLHASPLDSDYIQEFIDAGYIIEKDMSGDYVLTHPSGEEIEPELLPENLDIAWQNLTGQVEDEELRYGKFTLPGGDSYRELLLTLPTNKFVNTEIITEVDEAKLYLHRFNKSEMQLEVGDNFFINEANWHLAKETKERVLPNYQSPHYSIPNILVHVRFDDRIDPDGQKILFINEIQSDWAQEGKRYGFITRYSPDEVKPIYPTIAEGGQPDIFWYFEVPNNVLQISKRLYPTEKLALNHVLFDLQPRSRDAIQLGPYVGSTEAWVSLAVKRMMHYAADNGYNGIAWANGQQLNELYDLRNQVEHLDIFKRDNGTYRVGIYEDATVKEYFEVENFNQLENMIGKDLALVASNQDQPIKTYTNLDLAVGGHGMRVFYDKIVPNTVNKLLKRFGGDQLKEYDLGDGSVSPYVIDAENIGADWEYKQEVIIRDRISLDGVVKPFNSIREAHDWLDIHDRVSGIGNQLGFDITDNMRQTVLKGMPLFRLSRNSIENVLEDGFVLEDALSAITTKWHNLPEILVVGDVDELPFASPANAQAAVVDNQIYLVENNIHSFRDLQKVVAHEAIGHIGFRELFDNEREYGEFLHHVLTAAQIQGSRLNDLMNKVQQFYPLASPETKAQELIALAVEHSLNDSGEIEIGYSVLKSLYARTAQFVRSIGIDIPLSNYELQGLIVEAGSLVKYPFPDINPTFRSLSDIDNGMQLSKISLDIEAGIYRGTIVETSSLHAMQDIGRGTMVVHDKRDIHVPVKKGEKHQFRYENKRTIQSDSLVQPIYKSLSH